MRDWFQLFRLSRGKWKLQGYDTFAREDYPVPGEYRSEAEAQKAARKRLELLEQRQPSASSGGQKPDGIQDRVYIIRPDGTGYRYLPDDWPS
jgi:hypothetical protein